MNVLAEDEPRRKWVIPFFSIWTGQALSLLGSQLVQFALIWWLTITTGSWSRPEGLGLWPVDCSWAFGAVFDAAS
jgi:hypothetical protein